MASVIPPRSPPRVRLGAASPDAHSPPPGAARSWTAFSIGVIVTAIAGLALLGWAVRSEFLRDIVPRGNSMVPLSAVSMMLCGLILMAASVDPPRWMRYLASIAACLVAGVGTLTLMEFLFNFDSGIRLWMFREALSSGNEALFPGRMAASTALCYVLAPIAFLATIWRGRRFPWLPSLRGLALTIGLIGGALLLTHGAALIFPGMGLRYVDMALNTSLCFTLIGSGLLAIARQEGQPQWVIQPAIGFSFLVALLLIVLTLGTAYVSMMGLYRNSGHVRQREEALKEIEEVLSGLAMLQMLAQEYAVSRRESLLATREELLSSVRFDFAEAAELTAGDPAWNAMLAEATGQIDRLLEMQTQMIESAREAPGPPASHRISPEGMNQQIWRNLLQPLRDFRHYEENELDRSREQAEREAHRTFLLLPIGFFISLAILLVNICYLNLAWAQQLSAETRKTAVMNVSPDAILTTDDTLRIGDFNPAAERMFQIPRDDAFREGFTEVLRVSTLHPDLPAAIEAHRAGDGHPLLGRTIETELHQKSGRSIPVEMTLQSAQRASDRMLVVYVRDISTRKAAEQQIREARDALAAANAQLELDVARRTSELQATVRELEAFSYAVAHDLRAPLRGIAGFTEILWEDYGSLFDAQARECFDRLLASTNRMAALIDDLLKLSRVTRDDFSREKVDLSEVARSIVASLRRSEPERQAEVLVEDGIRAEGDARLLGLMLENLIGNAWKFTAGRPDVRIEFKCRQTDEGALFSISDNGAGFDMRYAHKLFTPFQRLHHVSDFPGTGIGLATAQRIVNRHGGRIWAEAEVDKGATFYFSLPPA